MEDIEECLGGTRLYGEDLTKEELKRWFESEKNGYYEIVRNKHAYVYEYHALNVLHGYNLLKGGNLRCLSVGGAYGHELFPIAHRLSSIDILESSDHFQSSSVKGVPVEYTVSKPNSIVPFESDSFDLITCFGVLHHIPKVSEYLSELSRVLEESGLLLLREPIISMGDWREYRPGLTKNERGIPDNLLDKMISESELKIVQKRYCLFYCVGRLGRLLVKYPFNSGFIAQLDSLLCNVIRRDMKYHRTRFTERLAPTSVFYVLSKI